MIDTLDIGIPEGEVTSMSGIIKAMEDFGFKFNIQRGSIERGLECTFSRASHNVDIFIFYRDFVNTSGKEKEIYWSAMWSGNFMRRMAFPSSEFVYTRWQNSKFLVPKKTHEWIQMNYGPNWENPVDSTSWQWWSSPSNYLDGERFQHSNTEQSLLSSYSHNLLQNPSFEETDEITKAPKYWNLLYSNTSIFLSNNSHTGQRSLQCSSPSCVIFQDVHLNQVNTSKLFLSGWSRILETHYDEFSKLNSFTLGFVAFYYDGNSTLKSSVLTEYHGNGITEFSLHKKDWIHSFYELIFFEPVIKLRVMLKFCDIKGTVLFDDIAVREILPECNCNSHGECIFGKCYCYIGFSGKNCDTIKID